jgi:hypothetical protein
MGRAPPQAAERGRTRARWGSGVGCVLRTDEKKGGVRMVGAEVGRWNGSACQGKRKKGHCSRCWSALFRCGVENGIQWLIRDA